MTPRNAPTIPHPSPPRSGVFVALFLLGTLTTTGHGQPAFFEPKEGFYGARGTAVTAAWAVEPGTIREGEFLTATLTVRGATNPHEIARPDLRKLSAYTAKFDPIEDTIGPAANPGTKEVAFAYRLRPRNRDVTSFPTLTFAYLNPAVTTSDPFQRLRVKWEHPITVVVAAAKPPPPAVPLDASDHLFDVPTGPRLLVREPFAPPPWAWPVLAALAPLVAGAWYVAWRRVYPDEARLARQRRSVAVRRAAAAIRRAGKSPDPAAGYAAAVVGFLRTRYALPPGVETPAEVGDALRAAGLSERLVAVAVALLRRCDAARFAPSGRADPSLADDARQLVAHLEAG